MVLLSINHLWKNQYPPKIIISIFIILLLLVEEVRDYLEKYIYLAVFSEII